MGWRCDLVVEHLPSMHEALDLIHITAKHTSIRTHTTFKDHTHQFLKICFIGKPFLIPPAFKSSQCTTIEHLVKSSPNSLCESKLTLLPWFQHLSSGQAYFLWLTWNKLISQKCGQSNVGRWLCVLRGLVRGSDSDTQNGGFKHLNIQPSSVP
jgi:hypothetical protein